MTVAILVWMLLVFWIVLGAISTFPADRATWRPFGSWVLLAGILVCLTLKVYPIAS